MAAQLLSNGPVFQGTLEERKLTSEETLQLEATLSNVDKWIKERSVMGTDITILEVLDIPDADMDGKAARSSTLAASYLKAIAQREWDGITIPGGTPVRHWMVAVMYKDAGVGCHGTRPLIHAFDCRAKPATAP